MVDIGVFFHVTSRKDIFASYIAGDFGLVRMENDGAFKIISMGDVSLETNTGCELLLKIVWHVSDIMLNLISIGKLDDKGYESYFGRQRWKLTKSSLVMAREKKSNSLYTIEAKVRINSTNVMEKEVSIELWHKRLGHMSEKGLQRLVRKDLLPGIKGAHLQNCVNCIHGK